MSNVANGVLRVTKKGTAFLRDPARSFRSDSNDILVSQDLVKKFSLTEGALIHGTMRRSKRGGQELATINRICDQTPERFAQRQPFKSLVAIDPCERFDLGATGDIDMRIIDLIAPIGKGTRGLIVSPPKAGKTMLLEKIAQSIRTTQPETRIVVLLIDERPEEVTCFRRAVDAEVLASSNDQTIQEHVELAELTLANVRTDLECGRDVVVLVDSLTRMGRAFNLNSAGSGRTMSGGMEAGALVIPRQFFGLARNIEFGGSVTIIATALVDTGSRMDQLIFEEFKGTGNSEIVLDREMADARIYPAIDIKASATRKEELLYPPETVRRIAMIRRALADRSPREMIEALKQQLERHETNEAFLDTIKVGKY